MDNYIKGDVIELEDIIPLTFAASAIHMKVNYGSKVRNLMTYATKAFESESVRQLTWTGSGNAVAKAISCAEIMKKRHKDLYQITNIRYKRVEEYWNPTDTRLEKLRVNRDVPAVTVLLSKDPLDPSANGYQAPETSAASTIKSKQPKLNKNKAKAQRQGSKSDQRSVGDASSVHRSANDALSGQRSAGDASSGQRLAGDEASGQRSEADASSLPGPPSLNKKRKRKRPGQDKAKLREDVDAKETRVDTEAMDKT